MATHITPNLFHFLVEESGKWYWGPATAAKVHQQGWTTAFYQHFCKIQLSCPLKEKNANNCFHFRLEKERKEKPTRKSLQSNSESCFYVSEWLSRHQIWYFWPSYARKAGPGMTQYFAVWWHLGRCETWVLTRGLSSRGPKDTSWGAVGWVLLQGVGGISDFASLVKHGCFSGEHCPAASRELHKQHQAVGKHGIFHALSSWSLVLLMP